MCSHLIVKLTDLFLSLCACCCHTMHQALYKNLVDETFNCILPVGMGRAMAEWSLVYRAGRMQDIKSVTFRNCSHHMFHVWLLIVSISAFPTYSTLECILLSS